MHFKRTVGLGTFPFSNVFSPISSITAEEIIKCFVDQGGKYIQTAPYYEGVDDLIGTILPKIPRDQYFLSTLCVKNRQGERVGNFAAIIEQCNDSLQHLRLEYIDLYMTSTTKTTDATLAETIGAMEDLKKQGKIRHIGVTNVTLDQLREYNASKSVEFVQNRFSFINRSADRDFNDYCSQHNISMVPYGVIEHGLLTSKNLSPVNLRENDLRHVLPEFGTERRELLSKWVVHFLSPIAEKYKTTIEGLAIWWSLEQQNIHIAVVGATTIQQISANLSSLRLPVGSKELVAEMEAAYQALTRQIREQYGQDVTDYLGNVYK